MALLNNDIVAVTAMGNSFGQQIMLTHTYVVLGDAPLVNSINTDLDAVLTAWDVGGVNDVRTPYLACLSATYTLDRFRAQRIRPGRSAYRDKLLGFAGTNVNPSTVACDAGAINLRTFLPGRGHYATKHIGPAPDGASAAGLLTAAYKNLLGALANKLITAFVPVGLGCTLAPVVYNKKLFTFDIIQSQNVGAESRVMGRRVVGRGK
jgi:hypothetical protein